MDQVLTQALNVDKPSKIWKAKKSDDESKGPGTKSGTGNIVTEEIPTHQ